MDLTPEHKKYIDDLTYADLLKQWRFAPAGDPWFEGQTGVYWARRMQELKAKDPQRAVYDSKRIGWR